MDIVYLGLDRRPAVQPPDPATENTEAVDAVWAHAVPTDALEHVRARAGPSRIDLMLFFRTAPRNARADTLDRAAALVVRCHQSSPVLRHRYLPPPPGAPNERADGPNGPSQHSR
jgi:hypothetical protein